MVQLSIALIAKEDPTARRMADATLASGNHVLQVHPRELAVSLDVAGRPQLMQNGKPLQANGIIHKMSTDYRSGLDCLRAVQGHYVMLNPPLAVLDAAHKFTSGHIFDAAGVPQPRSSYVTSPESIKQAVRSYGFPCIIKQADGSEGRQVGLVRSAAELPVVLTRIQERGQTVVVQEFVKEAAGQDLRIIVVGNQVVAHMKRVAGDPAEFRANIHLGGHAVATLISRQEASVAVKAVKALGLDFAGVDLLRSERGPLVLEANSFMGLAPVASPFDTNVPEAIVKLLLTKIAALDAAKAGSGTKPLRLQ